MTSVNENLNWEALSVPSTYSSIRRVVTRSLAIISNWTLMHPFVAGTPQDLHLSLSFSTQFRPAHCPPLSPQLDVFYFRSTTLQEAIKVPVVLLTANIGGSMRQEKWGANFPLQSRLRVEKGIRWQAKGTHGAVCQMHFCQPHHVHGHVLFLSTLTTKPCRGSHPVCPLPKKMRCSKITISHYPWNKYMDLHY